MNNTLAIAALVEVATGLALIAGPSSVASLLIGAELPGAAVTVGRMAGVGLLALGIACWPRKKPSRSAVNAMVIYGLVAAVGLSAIGFISTSVGPLLWPAVALHSVLTLLLSRPWFSNTNRRTKQPSAAAPDRNEKFD